MYKLFFIGCILGGLAACSSSNGDGNGSAAGDILIPENVLNKRIKTKSIDYDQDGSIDQQTTYNYDSLNRVATRVVEFPTQLGNDYSVTYTYQDGVLVAKTSERHTDTHIYESGLLVSSARSWDGDHTYGYDTQGRLVTSTGDDYLFDDDCAEITAEINTDVPSFTLNYSGNKVSSIVSVDNQYTLNLTTEGSRLVAFEQRYSCPNATEDFFEATTFSYDDSGRLIDYQRGADFGVSSTAISYDANGKVERLVRTDGFDTTTTVLSRDGDGLLLQQEVNSTEDSLFRITNYTVIIGYEDGDCVVSLSSNPANLAIADLFIRGPNVDPYFNCGYHLDEIEF